MTNKQKDLLSTVLAACITFATPAYGATYYVAPTGHDIVGAGTQANPLATPQFCIYQTHPGDSCLLMTGTYKFVQMTHSGAKGQYITLGAAPGQHPVITKDGTSWNAVSVPATTSWVVIQGLDIEGNARNFTLASAEALNVHDPLINGNCIGVAQGAHHVVIRQNTTAFCPGAGIMYLGDYGYIYQNRVHDNSWWSPEDDSGIDSQGYNYDTSTGPKILIYDNVVYNNINYMPNKLEGFTVPTDGRGIIVDSNIPNNYTGRTEIYNNVLYGNGLLAIGLVRSAHLDVYNNTCYQNAVTSTLSSTNPQEGNEIAQGGSTDIKVANNILVGTPGVGMGYTSDPAYSLWDYNLIYNPGGPVTPLGSHDINANPDFNPSGPGPNFHLLLGSPAIGTGTSALAPTYDIQGHRRTPTQETRGAYSYP